MFGKKTVCTVCGARFKVTADMVYTVQEKHGFVQALSGGVGYHDAIDCPKCGCQMILNARVERAPFTVRRGVTEQELAAFKEASDAAIHEQASDCADSHREW